VSACNYPTDPGAVTGLLRPARSARVAGLRHYPVAAGLARYAERFWAVRWDRRDQPLYRSQVIPHPVTHLTVENSDRPQHGHRLPAALVHGVVTRRFEIDLAGWGTVIGLKFRPGGFAAITGTDAAAQRDRVTGLAGLFGPGPAAGLVADVLGAADDGQRAALIEAFLLARLPAQDPDYELVAAITGAMRADRGLSRVSQAAARFAVSERSLQRLFRRYVGVGPKWVLARYRVHDALAAIDADPDADLTGLAAGLGWFDQAHFSKEFSALVGCPPAQYQARARRDAAAGALAG
jgi:AraC-like DNA-binding protein